MIAVTHFGLAATRRGSDNNAAEMALLAVALGRKNYLFGSSDTGGERAAALYTLIGTKLLSSMV